jgi:NADH-quinone oxidoreductase subunit N
VIWDPVTQVFNILSILIVLSVTFILMPGLQSESKIFKTAYEQSAELLVCLLFSGLGLGALVSSNDLTSLFIGLETLSVALYCLCGFYRTELRSTESGFKYLMIGAFSTAVFLYGLAFLYGFAGSTEYSKILEAFKGGMTPIATLGIIFTLAGVAFKLAFVPFHLYTADVYEGAPTAITGFLATITKLGMIGAALRLFWYVMEPAAATWQPLWIGLCLLSILIGNIGALQQRTLKKLVAFSSISHAGFLGLGLLVANPKDGQIFPLMAYLIIYSAMSLGFFALLSYIENREQIFKVEDLKGYGRNNVWSGLIISLFMLGMAGIPPFAGFMIKFWIFQALIEQGFLWVALIAVIGSIVGAAYYLRILMLVFMSDEQGPAASWTGLTDRFFSLRLVVACASLLTVLGGIRPSLYADWIFSALSIK